MNEEVKAFKNELRNLKFYRRELNKAEEQKELYFYALSGMTGKGFDHSGGTTNQELKEERKLETLEKIRILDEQIDLLRIKIAWIEKLLTKCDERLKKIMVSVYCDGRTYFSMSVDEHYAPRTLEQQVDKEIKRILK